MENQNIYITSEEEIKEGDWFYDGDGELCKYTSDYTVDPNTWEDNKKIILTTEKDLIADGVQTIDDEFIEWFVNNPGCEYVEVKVEFIQTPDNLKDGFYYKIIIPQEEPNPFELPKVLPDDVFYKSLESKQESIEEAAERYVTNEPDATLKLISKYSFKDGARWQTERMYSEEEVLKLWNWLNDGFIIRKSLPTREELIGWFEQFKKK
jgi:hypothetical protein